jgi:hypothetical protein
MSMCPSRPEDRQRDLSWAFGAYYYAHDCGNPYRRDETWRRHFGNIAERIVRSMEPATVLDAGCAMGILVEQLRERGVDAYGLDISPYAIEQMPDSVREHCWVASLTDPLPRRYDLVICIEVLEHLPAESASDAIGNLCAHTDDVLFSSSPVDFVEATHLNVRPPEYWAELFVDHGFYHDVDFDASFVLPWAARYRRARNPARCAVGPYERRLWHLPQSINRARDSLLAQHAALARLEAELDEQRSNAARSEHENATLISELRAQLDELRGQLSSAQEDKIAAAQHEEELSARLHTTEAHLVDLERELVEKSQEASVLQERCAVLTSTIESLRSSKAIRYATYLNRLKNLLR